MVELKAKAEETVVHPIAYNQGKIEVWDFIVDQNLSFCEGSAVKYICRWRTKNGVEDLRKAIQYIEKQIDVREEEARNEGLERGGVGKSI